MYIHTCKYNTYSTRQNTILNLEKLSLHHLSFGEQIKKKSSFTTNANSCSLLNYAPLEKKR